MSNRLPNKLNKLEAGILAATSGLTLALGGCATNPVEARPVETTSQLPPSQGGETNKGDVEKNWQEYATTTVEKYPDIVSAARHLMGNDEGKGTYSQILRYAGYRGEALGEGDVSAPDYTLVALFGPEPTDGYPSNVQAMITELNKKYNLFVGAHYLTKDAQVPFKCRLYYTDIVKINDTTVSGTFEERCDTRNLPGNNKVNFVRELDVYLGKYTDPSTGKENWRITGATDGAVIEAPHDNTSTEAPNIID